MSQELKEWLIMGLCVGLIYGMFLSLTLIEQEGLITALLVGWVLGISIGLTSGLFLGSLDMLRNYIQELKE